jgi:hypothetical protein
MNGVPSELDRLTRRQRIALRTLLIRATAVSGRHGDRSDLAALVAAAPVDLLPRAAGIHRVGGTVLRGLDGVPGLPPQVAENLLAMRTQSTFRHLAVVGALDRIGRDFDERGLSWIVMKGPAVAALLYPEPGDRLYKDLDLLVSRHDFPVAVGVLESLGYWHNIHNWSLAEEQLIGEIGMSNGPISIDLHWHVHFSRSDRLPFALEPEAMIERGRVASISGLRAPVLDPVDNLIALSFHAARSDGHRLLWLKDIERALAVERADLDEVVRRARRWRCAPPVGVTLNRARELLGAEVPRDVIRALTPDAVRLSDRLVSELVHPIQMHERQTPTRWLTRSVRSSVGTSIGDVPARSVRWLVGRVSPPSEHETDDPVEKERYFRAVMQSVDR